LYSFNNNNAVYIGKTKNVEERCLSHQSQYYSPVYTYVKTKLNNDWTTVNVDIIDAIDMSIDLLYLLDDPYNYKFKNFRKITGIAETQQELLEQKIRQIEYYYIDKYSNDDRYDILNISKGIFCKDIYEFYKKNDLNTFVIYRYNMPRTEDEKKAHAEYQRKYRERKMSEIGIEEYKQIEKKKALDRMRAKVMKILKEENETELIEKLDAMKMAADMVNNLEVVNPPVVKRGRGRPKKT